MKYYFKLVNNSKIETRKEHYEQWLYNLGDDYVISYGDSNNVVHIKKDKILLGYVLGKE